MSLAARPSDPKNSNMSKEDFLAKIDRVRHATLMKGYFNQRIHSAQAISLCMSQRLLDQQSFSVSVLCWKAVSLELVCKLKAWLRIPLLSFAHPLLPSTTQAYKLYSDCI